MTCVVSGLPSVAVPVPAAAGPRNGASEGSAGGAVRGCWSLRRAKSETF